LGAGDDSLTTPSDMNGAESRVSGPECMGVVPSPTHSTFCVYSAGSSTGVCVMAFA
jgi:hypothetical protein